ncbi:MAG: tetratricopeptide repeat protein [Candidatus Omnitrophica bacterium]|nr:tetratricopeptide repeat protein [Candidatus Omnitrophota bacterium]
MKKWLGCLFVVTLVSSAMNAFADDQAAVSSAKMAAESQPATVSKDDPAGQAPVAAMAPATTAPVAAAEVSAPAAAAAPAAEVKAPINFGDYRSSTLTTKAWNALGRNDIEAVLAYTNKCISLYSAQAAKMQAGLKDYPTGSNDNIFKYWALNDVATSYYIQAEAYRKANMKDEAKAAYDKVIKDYSFGQTWDTKGWFWKPAKAAQEKLDMMKAGVNWDFGDYSSSTLVQKAWAALAANDLKGVEAYVNKTVELYGAKAKEMQASLKEYPWESKQKTFSYWALNDVGTALFILGEAYQNAGDKDDAAKAYKRVINEFFYAQCWDPSGWFWKPAEAAQQKLGELDNV